MTENDNDNQVDTPDAAPEATMAADAVEATEPTEAAEPAEPDAHPPVVDVDGEAPVVDVDGEAPVVDADAFAAQLDAAATPVPAEGAEAAEAAEPAEGDDATPRVPFVVEEWMYGALEALVFASSDALSASRAKEVLAAELAVMEGREGQPEPALADVKAMFRTLLERWSNPERQVAHGFRLVELEGGLALRTSARHARFIRRMQLGKPQRLSRASLETLAVIAYRQPVTKPQIEEVRGVDSGGALKALLDKKLVRVIGKAEEIGRPLLYGTTKTFLEFFELQSLTDLPTLKELHELEHGVTEPVVDASDDRPAVVMDLFNADQVTAVSEETERESNDALEALEQALGAAKDVAKRASSLVFGMEVEDEDGAPAKPSAPTAPEEPAEASADAAPAAPAAPADEEPKA